MNTLIHQLRAIFALPIFANVANGTHDGNLTKNLEQTTASRYLIGKIGSTLGEVDICDADDLPLGVITDEGTAGDPVNVALLGATSATLLMVASEPIAAGSTVYAAASGKVQNEPAVAGDYYHIGYALTAAAGNGEAFEVNPIHPRKTKVLAPFSGTAGTDITNLGTAMADAPDKIIVL